MACFNVQPNWGRLGGGGGGGGAGPYDLVIVEQTAADANEAWYGEKKLFVEHKQYAEFVYTLTDYW